MAEQFVTDFSKLSKTSQHVAELNAKQFGITPEEYIIMRGGVDPVTHKYGDSYDPNVDLTPAEYTAAIAGKTGADAGKAINAATEAKVAKYNQSVQIASGKFPDPSSPEAFQFNEMLKGKATSGQKLTPAEQDWVNIYLGNFGPNASKTPTPTPTPTGPTGPTLTTAVTPTGTGSTQTPAAGSANLVVGTGTSTATLSTPAPTTTLTYKASDGTVFTDQSAYVAYQKILTDKAAADSALSAENATKRQSAYDLLYSEFSKYGLGSLVQPLESLIKSGASPDEFSLKLRESDAYKKRFAANAQRISKGLAAISEAEYIGLEDQYQNILRNAGLPESYWKQSVDPRTGIVSQDGFSNFIANDVSALELKDRVDTAQQRLIYANPEVSIALKTFYPDITNGDLLAYSLDPTKGLEQIKRRITAAEIGSSAVQMGLATNVTDAEYLARYGVTKAQAQQGYRTAAEILPTASKLGDIYATQGLGPYTQQTAEQEIFNTPGAAEAAAKRRKLAGLEQAAFSGQAGAAQGALARERAGNF